MLSAFLVFNADTGALVYHRRYDADFGIPNARQQASLADPVGLALQLYAFSRFSSSFPKSPQLQVLHFGEIRSLGNIFLATEELSEEEGLSARRLTLAAFGDLAPDFGAQIARNLLRDFIEENTRAVHVLHPSSDAKSETAPRSWHFNSLDITLEAMVDCLVCNIAEALPQFPRWVCLLRFDEDMGHRAWEQIAVAQATPVAPKERKSDRRPQSFARRLLHKGVSAITACSPRKSTDQRPSSSGGRAAQGQVTWWRRQSHSGHFEELHEQENFMLTCFWYEGSEEQVLPSKTSTPVLELATALLESSSINAGWTLVQLQPHFWFYEHMGCMQCVAFHFAPYRTYFLVPITCLFVEGLPEKWDPSVLQTVCTGARQKISSELEELVKWLKSKAGACGYFPKKKKPLKNPQS